MPYKLTKGLECRVLGLGFFKINLVCLHGSAQFTQVFLHGLHKDASEVPIDRDCRVKGSGL